MVEGEGLQTSLDGIFWAFAKTREMSNQEWGWGKLTAAAILALIGGCICTFCSSGRHDMVCRGLDWR